MPRNYLMRKFAQNIQEDCAHHLQAIRTGTATNYPVCAETMLVCGCLRGRPGGLGVRSRPTARLSLSMNSWLPNGAPRRSFPDWVIHARIPAEVPHSTASRRLLCPNRVHLECKLFISRIINEIALPHPVVSSPRLLQSTPSPHYASHPTHSQATRSRPAQRRTVLRPQDARR